METVSTSAVATLLAAERRHAGRLPLLRPVQYVWDGQLNIGELQDIGEDGLRMRTTRTLPVGAQIKLFLSLPLPDGRSRMCLMPAKVVWQRQATVGLAFTDLPPESEHEVHQLAKRETA